MDISSSSSFNMNVRNETILSRNTSHTNESDTTLLLAFSEVTTVIYTTVFIVGLLGNALVIYVVARYTKMKTVTNIYILNLAVADELYILGIPFVGISTVLTYWPLGDFLCKVCMTADCMSQFASTFCLTLMSIDRFLAVVHPTRSTKWRKRQMAWIFSGLVWVISFLMALPITVFSLVQEETITCNITWPEPKEVWSIVFILCTSMVGFFGPLIVISVCYLLIVVKVKTASTRAGLTKRRKSEHKVTRLVVVIVLVFVICWLPFFTVNIVNLFYVLPDNGTVAAVYFSLVILTYVNSCANPVLYGFFSYHFKRSFREVLCFCKEKGPKSVIETVEIRQNIKTKNIKILETEPFTSKPAANGQ